MSKPHAVSEPPGDLPPIVAVGASAGGLEALKEMLPAIPPDSGACFVVVQHLDPKHKSILSELLSQVTSLSVDVVEDGAVPSPDTILVIPEDATLTLEGGRFRVRRPAPPRNSRTPIDSFIESVAAEAGERGIAVILSGAGSDGSHAVRTLKAAEGYIIVQDPATAAYDSMPRNALATGIVDQTLPPDRIPEALVEYLLRLGRNGKAPALEQVEATLPTICRELKRTTGHDFRLYKDSTLLRRIGRRMQNLRIDDIAAYAERLREDPAEARQLVREFLISVTSFFRDPDAFKVLERAVEQMLAAKTAGETVRVWVAGCATGEEAYSLGMLLREKVDGLGRQHRIQIFATDIDEAALAIARRGIYPSGIAEYVPERYLERYFRPLGETYRLAEEIRELCVFSTQSLVNDPPFSRLDLLSCRNVFIYLKPELQNRLLPIFGYALRPNGCLLLGPSENVSGHEHLFEAIDKKWRLFRRRPEAGPAKPRFPLMQEASDLSTRPARERPGVGSDGETLVAEARRVLLDELGPAFAIVGANREVIYTGGGSAAVFRLAPGAPNLDLVSLVDSSLQMDVRTLWHRLTQDAVEVRLDHVTLRSPERRRRLRLVGRPLGDDSGNAPTYLIVFEDLGALPEDHAAPGEAGQGAPRLEVLEAELKSTREYLASSSQELKSANEELRSMNEELQSSNEELETSKEELQSVNEELEALNAELAHKVEELGQANADLENLLKSTEIATIFLDREGCLRRFTPQSLKLFKLIERDVGRPISDIATRGIGMDVSSDVARVLETLEPIEREVRLSDGEGVFLMRLFPYSSPTGVVDGAVLTFVDVSSLKRAQELAEELNARLKTQIDDLTALLDLAPIGIAFADDDGGTVELNRFGRQLTGLQSRIVAEDSVLEKDGRPVPPEERPILKAWRTGEPVRDQRGLLSRNDAPPLELLMSAAPVFGDDGKVRRVIGTFVDVTPLARAHAEAEARAVQNAYVADLGRRSLSGARAEALIAEIPDRLAAILGTDYAKVLLCRSDGDLDLVANHGFPVELGTRVEGGLHSQAGYTLMTGEPVIVRDLATDHRFQGPPLLRNAGVVSGLSVIIGDPAQPLGAIGVHTVRPCEFSEDDKNLMQSVANLVASALRRDAADRQKRLLLDELRHRVKNMLATVQSVTSMSLREAAVPPSTVRDITDRLRALARAHDLNFRREDSSIELRELVELQVLPYDDGSGRVTIEGRGAQHLPPSTAIDMSMLIHELATNAVKHGALSERGGEVGISLGIEKGGRVTIDWRERLERPVEAPIKEGSGSRLLRAISLKPQFEISQSYDGGSFSCRIVLLPHFS